MKIRVLLGISERVIYSGEYIKYQNQTGMSIVKKEYGGKIVAIIPKEALIIVGDDIEKVEE
jgi:hypothetical protein